MNAVFSTSGFWRPYLTLEADGVSKEKLAAQLERLEEDFLVRTEIVTFEHAGRPCTAPRRFVEFRFSCGERFSLVVEYEPDVMGCSKTLFLEDAHSRTKNQMGWRDGIRSHPYCLQAEELRAILECCARWDPRWQGQRPELPLLLLCDWVGLADAGVRDSLAARVEAAMEAVIAQQAGEDPLEIPVYGPRDDYRWKWDKELGWVFTSDKYCCYSLRNRPHAGSEEGCFPFAAFREMMEEIQERMEPVD